MKNSQWNPLWFWNSDATWCQKCCFALSMWPFWTQKIPKKLIRLYQALWHDNYSHNIAATVLIIYMWYHMHPESISIFFQTCKIIIRESMIKQKWLNMQNTTFSMRFIIFTEFPSFYEFKKRITCVLLHSQNSILYQNLQF